MNQETHNFVYSYCAQRCVNKEEWCWRWMGRKVRGAWEQGYDVVFKVDQSFQLPHHIEYSLLCVQVDQVGQSGEYK